MTSPIKYVPMTSRQEARLARLMVRVRKIVERVTPLVYGKLTIRQFRRDLPTGVLDKHLTPRDRSLLRLLQAHEGEVVLGFYAAIVQQATRYQSTGWADDLIQEASEAVVLAMYGYDGSAEICTYFTNVIQRVVVDNVRSKRYRTECQLEEESNVTEPYHENDTPEFSDDDRNVMREAMESIHLEPLERVVMDLFLEGVEGFQSEAARRVINPRKNTPYTRANAGLAFKRALKKIEARFNEITIRRLRKAA